MRRTLRRHPFLLSLLTLVILSQTGCQSGFFGPCGPCANNPLRRFRERIFSRAGSLCGGGGTIISDVPVYEGAPPAVVTPAPVLTPGAVLPAPAEVSPQIEPLETVPSASPGAESSGTQGARAPSGKVNYEASRPRDKIGRYSSRRALRTYVQRTPVPTSRSALGSLTSPAPVAAATKTKTKTKRVEPGTTELSLLDNLPPLDLPRDMSRSRTRTTSTPVADREARVTMVPDVIEESGAETGPQTEKEVGYVTVAPEPRPETDVVTAAPGLRRFAVVEPKLAGGSLPTSEGLDWLVEKGYKTLVDLREPSEIEPSFIADASKRGMRYISLPMSLATLDQDHVARFHFEISLADARPIYFFDTEGNRPGMLWYIHRMTDKDEGYDLQEAAREAEELGLTAQAFWKAAETYVADAKAQSSPMTPVETTVSTGTSTSRPVTSAPPTPVESAPEPDPARASPPESGIPAKPEALAVPLASSLDLAAATTTPAASRPGPATTPAPPAAAGVLRDPNAWRPFLALLLTALGVPCAYWSRSILSFRGLKRASLPGPGRQPRSLPAASGE